MDPPVVHFNDTIAAAGEGAVVRGHDEGDAFGGDDFEEEIEDDGAGLFVERAGGLIGEEDGRAVHESSAEGGALALAAGELLDARVKAVSEAGAFGELVQAGTSGGAIDASGDGGDEAVLFEREIWDEVVELKDEADFVTQHVKAAAVAIDLDAVEEDASLVGFVEATEEMKERALAAAGWAAEGDGLAGDGFEVDAFEDFDGAVVVGLADVFGAEDDSVGNGDDVCHSKRSASTARIRMA
jgi:hypothetical protein